MRYDIALIVYSIYKRIIIKKKKKRFGTNYNSHDAAALLWARVRACGMKGALVEFGNFQRLELLTLDAAELSHHHYHQATWIPADFSLLGLWFSLSKCMLIVFRVLHCYSAQEEYITLLRGWRRRAFNRVISIGEFMFAGERWMSLWDVCGLSVDFKETGEWRTSLLSR